MSAPNLFISHPRSGRTWIKRRLEAVVRNRGKVPADVIYFSHFGFDPMTKRAPGMQAAQDGRNVTVLLREVKAILASHFLMFNSVAERNTNEQTFCDNVEEWVRGEHSEHFGAKRIVDFLNDVDRVLGSGPINFLCYEDLFYPGSVADLAPGALGWTLTDSERDIAGAVGPIDLETQRTKHRLIFDPDLCDYIDRIVRDNCRLAAYRERYL